MSAPDNEALGASLAAVNALLNGTTAGLIVAAFLMIKQGRRDLHKKLMLSAFVLSSLFLCVYLTRVALTGTHYYRGEGALKGFYYLVLVTHMILAAATPPLVIRALFLALRGRLAEHKRLVKWAYPIWLYVSVTGVLVYFLLYHVS